MKNKLQQIDGVFKTSFLTFSDQRGKFRRIYTKDYFKSFGATLKFKQINLSVNPRKYTLRGMHYQCKSSGEHKYIICVSGKIQLVLMDTRKYSNTYLQSLSCFMDAESDFGIFIPAGVATGWITLQSQTKILYIMGADYDATLSKNFSYKDPLIKNLWVTKPKVISVKDKDAPHFKK